MLWGILRPWIPDLFPADLVEILRQVLEVMGELAFLAYLLGYAWNRQRPWFEGDPEPLSA